MADKGGSPLDRELLYHLYRTYGSDLRSLKLFEGRPAFGAAYHKEERRILYMMVRHAAPELIVELSPKRGLSTAHMALALEHIGRGRILSFELSWHSVTRAYRNLRDVGLAHRVELVHGDVREELPRALRRQGIDAGALRFLFIDSDHGAAFARWYLRALFPCVPRGGIVHVHDIFTDPLAALRDQPLAPTGEEHEVRRYFAEHPREFERLSVADCVRDAVYLTTVRDFGGGDVALDRSQRVARRGATHAEWNPSLWLRKQVEAESRTIVPVPFAPLPSPPVKRVVRAMRRGWLQWRQRA